jgi:hypothetical protein
MLLRSQIEQSTTLCVADEHLKDLEREQKWEPPKASTSPPISKKAQKLKRKRENRRAGKN